MLAVVNCLKFLIQLKYHVNICIFFFQWGKRLLVPLLRLKEGLLQIVSLPFAEPSAKILKSASTQKGIRKWGNKLITLDQNSDDHHIDMIIMGSVAVDKKGHYYSLILIIFNYY